MSDVIKPEQVLASAVVGGLGKGALPAYIEHLPKDGATAFDLSFFQAIHSLAPDLLDAEPEDSRRKEFFEAARMLKGTSYVVDGMYHHVARSITLEMADLVKTAMLRMSCNRAPA